MDLSSLRYFVAVAEEKSFSRASRRLFIAQPTLSRHVASLEEELGYRVFLRDTHRVELTEEGQLCLRYAREILANIERMKQMQPQSTSRGIVTVGFVTSVENLLVTAFVKAVRQHYPQVELVVVPGAPQAIRERFLADKLDILYLPLPMTKQLSGVQRVTIVRQGLKALVPAGHPLAARKRIHIEDLSGETLISFQPELAPEIYEKIMRLFKVHNVRPRQIRYVEPIDQIVMMVESGEGISINATIGVLDKYNVRVLPIEDCAEGFDVVACWKSGNPNPVLPLVTPLLTNT